MRTAHAIHILDEVEAALVAVAVEEHRRSGQRRAASPSGHMDPSAEQIASALEVCCAAEEVDVTAHHRRCREFVSQAIFELADPNGDRLSSNENDVPIADHVLDARDDALSLIQAQRRCRDLDRVERLNIQGWRIVAQERERAESKLIRARLGGKANASVSRLSCASVFSPVRRASTSARRTLSFSSQRSCASTYSTGTVIAP